MATFPRLIAVLLFALPVVASANYMPPCLPGDTLTTNQPGQFISYYTTGDSDLLPQNPGVMGLGATSTDANMARMQASVPAYIAKYPVAGVCNAFNTRTDRTGHRVNSVQYMAFEFANVNCNTGVVSSTGTQQHAIAGSAVTSNQTQYCEPGPALCSEPTGRRILLHSSGPGFPAERGCDEASNCVVQKVAGLTVCTGDPITACVGNYEVIGTTCTESAPADQEPVHDNPTFQTTGSCVGAAGVNEYCFGPAGSGNCGELNGEMVCLTSTPSSGCQVTAGGQSVCAPDAVVPPAPSAPANPDIKAPPDGELTAQTQGGQTAQYDVFGAATNAAAASPGTGGHGGGDVAGGVGDVNGDGFADNAAEAIQAEASPGTASGGATCASMPACDGSPIQCAILEQQWRARCDISGSVTGGDSCDAAPVCSGDPIQCALVTQQWRSRCVELGTPGDIQGQAGLLPGEVDGTALNSTAPAVEFGQLSEAGPLGGGSCPPPISFSVMGQSISLDVWAGACDLAVMVAPLLLALSYFGAALLVYRGVIA